MENKQSNLFSGTTENKGAGLSLADSSKSHDFVLANHDFLNQITFADSDALWLIKSRNNLGTEYGSETLNTLEIGMLNCHDVFVSKKLQAWLVRCERNRLFCLKVTLF